MTHSRLAGAVPGAAATITATTTATTRVPLTWVPLANGPLPVLDLTTPPWPGRQADSGGVRMHVRETPGPGDGAPTAVYVHGLGGSASNWTDLSAQLAGRVNGLAVDLPGFGYTEPPAGYDFTLRSHASTLIRFVQGLGVGPVHLFGNSFGGTISLALAAHRPDLVRTVTLVSPAVPDRRPSVRRMSDPRLPLAFLPVVGARVRRQLAEVTPRQQAEQVLRLCFADPSLVPEHRLVEAAAEITARRDMPWAAPALGRTAIGMLRAWLASGNLSLWRMLPKVVAPTLVVWGDQDKLVSVRKAPRTAELLPRGRLLVLPRTGHCAQIERPVSVARAVLGMWEAVNRQEW